MAENFGTAPGDLMHELEELIQGGKIRARIDSHKMVRRCPHPCHCLWVHSNVQTTPFLCMVGLVVQVLYAASTDQRESTYQKVMDVGEQVNQNSEAILRSISAAQNKLIVRGKARGVCGNGLDLSDMYLFSTTGTLWRVTISLAATCFCRLS
mgnify:CR=1 FL=1